MNDHVHIYAEYGRTLGGGRFAYWGECSCGDVVDYTERANRFLRPAPQRRLSWPLRLFLAVTVGLMACFAWVAIFDDHRSDLRCEEIPSFNPRPRCYTETTTP